MPGRERELVARGGGAGVDDLRRHHDPADRNERGVALLPDLRGVLVRRAHGIGLELDVQRHAHAIARGRHEVGAQVVVGVAPGLAHETEIAGARGQLDRLVRAEVERGMADQEAEAGGSALHVGVRELHELDGVTPDRHGRVRQEDVLRGLLVVEVLRSGDVEHLDREAARVEVGVSLLPADAVREPRDDALRRAVVGEDAEAGPRVTGVIEAELAVQARMGLRVEAALDRLVVLARGLPLDRLDLPSEGGELRALLGLAAEEVLRVHRRAAGGRDLRRERLAGECDHAFYSEAILFENGLESATSNVPTDAVLEEDGRHRIRPTFLTVLAPEARQALERGVVVRELGGEEDIHAVGAALGIPRPLVREHGKPAEGEITLIYKYAGGGAAAGASFGIAGAIETESDPLGVRKAFAALGMEMPELAAGDPMAALLAGVAMKMSSAVRKKIDTDADDEDEDDEDDGSGWTVVSSESRVSEDEGNVVSLLVNGGVATSEHGSDSRPMSRSSSAKPTSWTASSSSSRAQASCFWMWRRWRCIDPSRRRSSVSPRRRSARVSPLIFRFPDARLDRREDEEVPSASKPPPAAESLRQNMRTSVWDMMGVDASSIKIGTYVPARRAGEGELRIAVRTIEPPSLRVERITLSVREPLRVPVLPAWAKSPNDPDLASYAARDALVGWLAFEGAWSDVTAAAEGIVSAIAKVALASTSGKAAKAKGFGVRVRLCGREGEELTFEAPVAPSDSDRSWTKVRAELARGADVTFSLPWEREKQHASITLVHQPRGSNYRDDDDADDDDLGPPVVITFMVPRPDSEAAREELGKIARGVLERAGASAGSLGGFAIAGPVYPMSDGTAFEQMLGVCGGDDKMWVRSHVRTPGWAVLAPEHATLAKGKPGPHVERRAFAKARQRLRRQRTNRGTSKRLRGKPSTSLVRSPMLSEFIQRNAIVVGLLVAMGGAGALLGVIGCALKRGGKALGVAALLLALLAVGIGVAQRQSLIRAGAFLVTMPGLSSADRARIVAAQAADAGYALELSIVFALPALAAGALAVFLAVRRGSARSS